MGRTEIPFPLRNTWAELLVAGLLSATIPAGLMALTEEESDHPVRPPIKQTAGKQSPIPVALSTKAAPAARRVLPVDTRNVVRQPLSAAVDKDPCASKTARPDDVVPADDSFLDGPEKSRIELLKSLLMEYSANSEGCHDSGKQDSQFVLFVGSDKPVIDRQTRLWFAERTLLSPESANDIETIVKHYPSQDSISLHEVYTKRPSDLVIHERWNAVERLRFLEDTLQQVQLVYVPRFERDGDCYRTYNVVLVPSKSFDSPVRVATSDPSKLPLTPSLLGEKKTLEQVVESQNWIKRLALEREGECTPDTGRQTGLLYKADAIHAALAPLTKALGQDFVEASTNFWNKVRTTGDLPE